MSIKRHCLPRPCRANVSDVDGNAPWVPLRLLSAGTAGGDRRGMLMRFCVETNMTLTPRNPVLGAVLAFFILLLADEGVANEDAAFCDVLDAVLGEVRGYYSGDLREEGKEFGRFSVHIAALSEANTKREWALAAQALLRQGVKPSLRANFIVGTPKTILPGAERCIGGHVKDNIEDQIVFTRYACRWTVPSPRAEFTSFGSRIGACLAHREFEGPDVVDLVDGRGRDRREHFTVQWEKTSSGRARLTLVNLKAYKVPHKGMFLTFSRERPDPWGRIQEDVLDVELGNALLEVISLRKQLEIWDRLMGEPGEP